MKKKRKRRNNLGLDTVKPVHEYFRVIGRVFLCLWLISMMLHSWGPAGLDSDCSLANSGDTYPCKP